MKRLECLDGLRGVLAIYVALGHMAPFAMLPLWLQSGVSHGGAAVDVFFILSGLVMGLGWWCVGLLALISIIGIPWGRACFVIGRFAFLPFGREAVNRR